MRRSAKVVGGVPSLNAEGGRDTVACRGDAASTSRLASCEAGFGPRQWGQGKHHEEEVSMAGAAAGCVHDDGFRAGGRWSVVWGSRVRGRVGIGYGGHHKKKSILKRI